MTCLAGVWEPESRMSRGMDRSEAGWASIRPSCPPPRIPTVGLLMVSRRRGECEGELVRVSRWVGLPPVFSVQILLPKTAARPPLSLRANPTEREEHEIESVWGEV